MKEEMRTKPSRLCSAPCLSAPLRWWAEPRFHSSSHPPSCRTICSRSAISHVRNHSGFMYMVTGVLVLPSRVWRLKATSRYYCRAIARCHIDHLKAHHWVFCNNMFHPSLLPARLTDYPIEMSCCKGHMHIASHVV